MRPPFSAEQFFDVFRRYNEAVWPAQIVLNVVAVVALLLALRSIIIGSRRLASAAMVLLAMLWLWSGLVYHKMFFATLTPAGMIFGSLFIAQSALLLVNAWLADEKVLAPLPIDVAAGVAIALYALLIYPATSFVLGHHYPAVPTFGAPCPTTIFTFGMACLLSGRMARFALAIPIVWTIIASTAALGFGVTEDLAMLVSAAIAVAVVHHESQRSVVKTLPARRTAIRNSR